MQNNLQICDNPLTFERKDFKIGCGLTVREMLRQVGHEWVLDGPAIITIESDTLVRSVSNYDIVPAHGETVGVRVIPSGSGGGGKNPLGIILSIAVIATAAYFGPLVAGYLLGPVSAPFGAVTVGGVYGAIASGAIAIAGNYVVNALVGGGVKPPSTSGISQAGQTSSVYKITGTQNAINKFGPIPVMIGGKTRVWPTMAAAPYTEIVGEDQYLRQRFAIIGPVELSDFKIGDDPVSSYQDVEVEWTKGFAGETQPTLYADGGDIDQQSINAKLSIAGGSIVRTTATDTKEIIFDIRLPQLFRQTANSGKTTSWDVTWKTEYRAVGEETWLIPSEDWCNELGETTVDGRYLSGRTFSYRFNVPTGQYELRWTRISEDRENDKKRLIYNETYVDVLRSISEHPGIDTSRLPPLSIIDLRIKASDQLNGVVDQFNFIADTYLPVYSGGSVSYELSDNPAWAFFNILYGNAGKRPITDLSRYDLDKLTEWATLCEAQGWKINGILDTESTTYRMLQTVAAVGRSSLSMINNKYGVATDWEKDTIIQVFTPRNSWGFESTKAWPDELHAIRASFVDSTSGYDISERIIYADGYDSSNATQFLDDEIQYITDSTQVWKKYRYDLADRILRPEIYTFSVDIENLRCTRGDRVRIVHDVMLVGLGQARIKSVTTDGSGNVTSATIDSVWTLDDTTSYAINIQRFNGSVYEGFIANPPSTQDVSEINFNPAIPAATAPKGGELIAFGEADRGVGLDLIIHEIQAGANLTAKLVCQDYAPGIQTAADGPIDPYTPNIQNGRNVEQKRPVAPSITSIDSSETIIVRRSDGSLETRAIMNIDQPNSDVVVDSYEVQFRDNGNDLWSVFGRFPSEQRQFTFSELEDGDVYDFRVRGISQYGVTSDWAVETAYTIIGKTTPPPAVDAVVRVDSKITWEYSQKPIDFAGYLVKYSSNSESSWDNAVFAHDPDLPVTDSVFDVSAFSGEMKFFVKAIDVISLESETARTITIDLGKPEIENEALRYSYDPTWEGVKVNCVVSGSLLVDVNDSLDMQYTATFDPADHAGDFVGDSIILDYLFIGGQVTSPIVYQPSDIYVEYRAYTPSDRAAYVTGEPAYVDGRSSYSDSSPFLPWPGSVVIEDGYIYEIRFTSPANPATRTLQSFDVVVDAKTITESFADQVIAAGSGTRLPITKTYDTIKFVNVRSVDGASSGFSVVVDDLDATNGPLLRVLDGSGTSVGGTINCDIAGY